MKRSSALFWAVFASVPVLTALLRDLLDYRVARAINIIIALIFGSSLFWLSGRRRENGR